MPLGSSRQDVDSLVIAPDSLLQTTASARGTLDADMDFLDLGIAADPLVTEQPTRPPHAVSWSQSTTAPVYEVILLRQSVPAPRVVPTTNDWETHRATIIRLYVDEDRTLRDLMRIMQAQHGFNGTIKMYKRRLTAWNVRKYMTRAEREITCRAINAKQRTGEAYGKVIVRGKERTPDVFLRHMKRPRTGLRRRRMLQCGTRWNAPDLVMDYVGPDPPRTQIRPLMYPAGSERIAEIVCTEMSAIVSTVPEKALSMCLSKFWRGAFLRSINGCPGVARILLNRAADWFHENIKSQPASTLLSVLHSQVRNSRRMLRHVELFASFDQHILRLTEAIYGSQHSLTQLLAQMMQVAHDAAVVDHVYHRVLRSQISRLARANSPNVSNWIRRLSVILQRLGWCPKAQAQLLEPLHNAQRFYSLNEQIVADWLNNYDQFTLLVVDEIASYLRNQGRDAEADQVDQLYRLDDDDDGMDLG